MKKKFVVFLRLILFILFIFSCKEPDNWVSLGSFVFTPNGDGVNELFKIPFDTTKTNMMIILDSKTNKEVLKTYQYQRNWWNGRQNNTGKYASEGLYSFNLEIDGTYLYYGYVYVKY